MLIVSNLPGSPCTHVCFSFGSLIIFTCFVLALSIYTRLCLCTFVSFNIIVSYSPFQPKQWFLGPYFLVPIFPDHMGIWLFIKSFLILILIIDDPNLLQPACVLTSTMDFGDNSWFTCNKTYTKHPHLRPALCHSTIHLQSALRW